MPSIDAARNRAPVLGLLHMYEFTDVACPYCGETIEVAVDTSGGSQMYIEDCQVCCRPIVMRLTVDEGDDSFALDASAENEG
ncbi:CPXCG motif-containing cysteine-rich protein [Xanthomonas sp. NCPPB 2632]|uniref:CPXCG motif-containing cysteine-rich protein n=2 Tax=Lysobacterales TaxID=135614 RepID=UPI00351366B8